MALIVKDKKIVGTIDKLEEKLEGKLPITREELFVLVNSWGRRLGFYTKDSQNKNIYININLEVLFFWQRKLKNCK